MKTKSIVVISDIQAPLHDKAAVAAVTDFVRDYEPDLLLCVGDEADQTEVSQWTKGTREEFAGTLQGALDQTSEVMAALREAAGDVPFVVQRSNHGDRIRKYVDRYAPGLDSLRCLDVGNLLNYGALDIEISQEPYPIGDTGWVMAHGDEAKGSSQVAGSIAMGLARKFRRSVICGHTHKFGMQHDHGSINIGKPTAQITQGLFGLEIGHLMDLRRVSYTETVNWQQGFALLDIMDDTVYPTLVPIIDNGFVVDGSRYGW